MRTKLIILFLLALSAASAQVIDTLPPRMAWATARVRMRAPGLGATAWTATLGDSSSFLSVRVQMPQSDEIYGRRCVAEASLTRAGEELPLGRAEFNSQSGEASVRIVYDGYSARIYAGDAANTLICRLDSLCPGQLAVDGQASLVEGWARYLPLPEPQMSQFASIDELLARVAESEDLVEGVWTYLDRDMDPARSSLGACYTLATVRSGDGYDIVYLGPSSSTPGNWHPLQIKGRLSPTIFIGHYDLSWLDVAGIEVGDEANAQLSPDGAILTLRFPLLASQLRFSRAPASALPHSELPPPVEGLFEDELPDGDDFD